MCMNLMKGLNEKLIFFITDAMEMLCCYCYLLSILTVGSLLHILSKCNMSRVQLYLKGLGHHDQSRPVAVLGILNSHPVEARRFP